MAQRSIRVDDIIERARARADMVDSEFWTAPQLQALAESKFQTFYLKFATKYEEYFATRRVVSTVAGTSTVQLAGFYELLKLRGVQHEFERFIRKIDLLESPNLSGSSERGKPRYYSYRIDPGIEFPFLDLFPTPDAVYRILIHYVPIFGLKQLQQTLGESQALYMLAAWDEYLVVQMAIAMKDREESDCSVLMLESQGLSDAMEKQLTPVDASEPGAVIQWGGRGSQPSIYGDPYDLEDYLG